MNMLWIVSSLLISSVVSDESYHKGNCVNLSSCPTLQKYLTNPSGDTVKDVVELICDVGQDVNVRCDQEVIASLKLGDKIFSTSENGCGMQDSVYQFPWIVSFIAIGWSLCSGSLLNKRYVLTAASCASQKSNFKYTTLLLGDFDLKNKCNQSDHCLQKQTFSIEEAIPHPLYNGTFNDIGLIRLNQSVVYTEYIRPICLSKNIRSFEMGDTLFSSGFVVHFDPTIQKERFKRNTTTIMKPNNVCTKWHQENGRVITMNEFNFCASDSEESQFPNTFMDIGGSAVSLHNNQWYVEGVLSMALDTADRSRPTVYTNVTYYLDWIESNMKPWN